MVVDQFVAIGAVASFTLGYLAGELNGRRKLALEVMEQQKMNAAKKQWEDEIRRMMEEQEDDEEN